MAFTLVVLLLYGLVMVTKAARNGQRREAAVLVLVVGTGVVLAALLAAGVRIPSIGAAITRLLHGGVKF